MWSTWLLLAVVAEVLPLPAVVVLAVCLLDFLVLLLAHNYG
jgi:hypothetical protein